MDDLGAGPLARVGEVGDTVTGVAPRGVWLRWS